MSGQKNHAISRRARAMLPRELFTWTTAAVMTGVIEGGLAGVVVKNVFAGQAPSLWVNLAVAVVAGAPAFANILSFVFAGFAHGRDKIRVMSFSMSGVGLGLLLMAVAPVSSGGLLLFCLGMVLARIFWSGVVTLRASVWRMNFSPATRARITSRMMTAASLVMALSSALMGLWLNQHPLAFRWIYPLAALIGILIALVYRRTRIRGSRRLLRAEQHSRQQHGKGRLASMLAILRQDRSFRHYMLAMMLFGSGNLMLMAPLIVVINEHFDLSRLQQILITASIPLLMVTLSVSLWARLLDGRHIYAYRAVHSWSFVLALGGFALAAIFAWPALFWLAAALLGIAYGGAVLGWNLGHNDFASDHDSTLYMGVHVTLTGIRGLLMPSIGVLVYQGLNALNPTLGPKALLLPFVLVVAGASMFVFLNQRRKRQLSGDHP